MELKIEIGNDRVKKIIEDELKVLTSLFNSNHKLNISKILVPREFDVTVSNLKNTSDYKAVREHHTASAITIKFNDEIYIVLSPLLYINNSQCRMNTIIHEFYHAINPYFSYNFNTDNPTKSRYTHNLFSLFDEYQSVRKSYLFCKKYLKEFDYQFKRDTIYNFDSHSKSLLDDSLYVHRLNKLIYEIHDNRDVITFLKNYHKYFAECALDFVYTFGILDACIHFNKKYERILISKLVNENTLGLIDFYRRKIEQESFDLFEGFDLIVNFMRGFGIEFIYKNNQETFNVYPLI